jgi:hypothetical protein
MAHIKSEGTWSFRPSKGSNLIQGESAGSPFSTRPEIAARGFHPCCISENMRLRRQSGVYLEFNWKVAPGTTVKTANLYRVGV